MSNMFTCLNLNLNKIYLPPENLLLVLVRLYPREKLVDERQTIC